MRHGVRIDVSRVREVGAGQRGGGAAVRDRVAQAVRGSAPGALCEEVAGKGASRPAPTVLRTIAGAVDACQRAVGGDEDGAGRPERRENRSDAALDQNPAGVDDRAGIAAAARASSVARRRRSAERVRRRWA